MDNNLKNKIEISDNKIKEVKDSLSLLKDNNINDTKLY